MFLLILFLNFGILFSSEKEELLGKAILNYIQEKEDDAISILEKILKKYPDDKETKEFLIKILLDKGKRNLKKEIEKMQKSISKNFIRLLLKMKNFKVSTKISKINL